MSVVIMQPSRALSADIGSSIFCSSREGLTYIGIKMNKNRLGKNIKEAMLFPLTTKWNNQQCHWPLANAKAAFGFNEIA